MVSTTGAIVIIVVVLLVAAAIGWVVFTNLRARRLGLPAPSLSSYLPWRKSDPPYGPPQPARGGIIGWFNDQVAKIKHRNNRSAAGAYEPRGRGFGPLDPDDAWDARVGHEHDAYGHYEEQELGGTTTTTTTLTTLTNTEYRGAGGVGGMGGIGDEESRGRQMERAPLPLAHPTGVHGHGHGHGHGQGLSGSSGVNPFDDDVEADMRGVSPRPMGGGAGGSGGGGYGGGADAGSSKSERPHSAGSSLAERKSIFREAV